MVKFKSESCPLCEQGQWLPQSDDTYVYRHARKTYSISGLHYALCNHCGVRGFLPGQRDENRRLVKAHQAKLPSFVSQSDLLALREKYALTQHQATKIFGGGKQGYPRWERGETIPAGPTARLIKLALQFPQVLKFLADEAGVSVDVGLLSTSTPTRIVTVYVATQEAFDSVDATFDGCTNGYSDVEFEIEPLTVESCKIQAKSKNRHSARPN